MGMRIRQGMVIVVAAAGLATSPAQEYTQLWEQRVEATRAMALAVPGPTRLTGDEFEVEFGWLPPRVERIWAPFDRRETVTQQIGLTSRWRVAPVVQLGYEARTGVDTLRGGWDEAIETRSERRFLSHRGTLKWQPERRLVFDTWAETRLSTLAGAAGTEEASSAGAGATMTPWKGTSVRGELAHRKSEDLADTILTRVHQSAQVEQRVPGLPFTLRGGCSIESQDRELAPWDEREVRQREAALQWDIAHGASWTVGAVQREVEQVNRWTIDAMESAYSQWQFAPWKGGTIRARAQVDQREQFTTLIDTTWDPAMTLDAHWQQKWAGEIRTGLSLKYRTFDTVTPLRMDDEETILSLAASGQF
jgi:hypothetical protein